MQSEFARWHAPFHWRLGVSIRKRLARLRRALGLATPGEFRSCRYYGADFLVQDDGIGAELLLKRFEWHHLSRFIAACRNLRPHALIDIGANIGTYTCVIGRAGLASNLIAFEPDDRNADHLERHLKINGLSGRVTLHRFAIGEKPATVQFQQGDGVHGALSRIVEGSGTTTVEVKRLDDVVSIARQPIVLKMDVEGHELPALRGAERTLRNNWGYAQIELLDNGTATAELMRSFGWDLIDRIDEDYIFAKGE